MLENARRVLSKPNFVRKRLLPATFLILALLAAVIFFSMGARSNAEVEYTGALDLTISHDYGQLEMITVQGTPEERGRQYGEQLKEAIEVNLGIFWETIDQKGYSKEEALIAGQEFEENMLLVDPVIIKEIAGMAGSTGISYEELLAFNALVEVVFDDECTTLLATGSATKDGKAYFHKTTDSSFEGERVAYKMITPDENYNYISIVTAGTTGPAKGINEHGLSTGNTAQRTWDTGDGLGNITINRKILQNASNVAEAIAYVESLDGNRSSGSTYLVADANEAAVIETTHSAMAVRWVVDEAIAITNHYTIPEMLGYCTRDDDSLVGSQIREARGNELLQEDLGVIDVEVMIDISQDKNEADENWCISRPRSRSGGTFNGANLLMHAQLGRPGTVPVELYDFGAILAGVFEESIQKAVAAIEAIPDTLTLYDMMEVRKARAFVNRALGIGASPDDIHNLAELEPAEEYLENLYRQDYMRQSILDLQAPYPPDNSGMALFGSNRRSSWWEHGRTVNYVCFLPLGSLTVSFANIDTPRWINYDISGRGYTHVKGYVGITDQDSRTEYPVTFQIHADEVLIYEKVAEFGEDAVLYLLDIEGVDTLRFTVFAEDTTSGGGANRIKIVEPQFLIPINSEMLDAIADAESAIAALPDDITLSDEPAVEAARSTVEEAFALGVDKDGRIGNLEELIAAEETIYSLYHEVYEADSIFLLGTADSANSWWFGRDFDERWDIDTNTGHTVNRVSFAPLKSFFTSYASIDSNPRWAEWDISEEDYKYVEGYAGISDETGNFGMPLEFTIFGDGSPIFTARLDYGADAVFYRLDLEDIDKLRFHWQAATEHVTSGGAAMRPVIVEPQFLYTLPEFLAKAVEAAESAIDELPDIVTLEDEEDVEAARALVETALALGAVKTNISNISILEDVEQVIIALKAAAEADEAIADLPVPVNLEDAGAVGAARAKVVEALELGAEEVDLKNLGVLEAAEAALAELWDLLPDPDIALENIEEAIASLPAEITLGDKDEVEKVRWMVNNAIYIGVQEEDISNLGDLEAAEAALADLTDVDYGDVNGDGVVNIQDVIMVMQHILNLIQLDEGQQLAADVDGSGDIDIDDVVLIMQNILSLIDKFPVEA